MTTSKQIGGNHAYQKAAEDVQKNENTQGTPSPTSVSYIFFNVVKITYPMPLTSTLFCGAVLHQNQYNCFHDIDSSDGPSGEAEKVIELGVELISSNYEKDLQKSHAKRIALSCGRLWVETVSGIAQPQPWFCQSGFWVERQDGQKFFLTVMHFHKGEGEYLDHASTQLRMEQLRDGGQYKFHVGTRLYERSQDSKTNIEVKLLAWDAEHTTGIFTVNQSDTRVLNAIKPEELGHIEEQSLEQEMRRVFTAGYCASDRPVDPKYLNDIGCEPAEIVKLAKLHPPNSQWTLFSCYRTMYLDTIGNSDPAMTCVSFSEIFKPTARASTGGRIGAREVKDENPKQNTYLASTDMSLFNGLSGSPVVTFIDHRWKVIGMGMALLDIRRLKLTQEQCKVGIGNTKGTKF